MNDSLDRTESGDFEQILASFHAALEDAADPEPILRDYEARHPDRAKEFRDAVRMRQILDHSAEEIDSYRPERLGDFRIVREISRGGMKIIYEAVQEPLERRVAVATIRKGRILSPHRERFLREQQVLARLHQTNIVPVFAAGEDGPIQYFAMPYIEGAALSHVVRAAFQRRAVDESGKTPPLDRLAEILIKGAGATVEPAPGSAETEEMTSDERPFPHTDPATQTLPLSREYFRSVARVMAGVADSLQHAHDHGFLHRDLKPANIMVDTSEQSWLIDFGLAGCIQASQRLASAQLDAEIAGPLTQTHQVMGTPGYMAPEQACGGETDERTDVWGLGVTLYELLTLRPAFPRAEGESHRRSVESRPPKPPRALIRGLPRDLEAVCLKALQVDPGRRYASASEFGADLNRWLRDEPTVARPARAPRRAYLWARRNKGWALAIIAFFFALIAIGIGGLMAAHFAEVARRRQHRETLILEIQSIKQAAQRSEGWSRAAWDRIREAADIRRDHLLQSEAVATLSGIDGQLLKRFTGFNTYRIAFREQGDEVVMLCGETGASQTDHFRIWNMKSGDTREHSFPDQGPVALLQDGTPVQLIVKEGNGGLIAARISEESTRSVLLSSDAAQFERIRIWAASPNGESYAAAGIADDTATVAVWEGLTGKLLHRFTEDLTALGFSLDGRLLAGGDENGRVCVWSVESGDKLTETRAGHCRIHDVAFARSRSSSIALDAKEETDGWLLAAADSGGTVAVWDLGAAIPRAYCRGSNYDAYAVAFSPDGTTLASTGRHTTRLWDLATGRLLLKLRSGNRTSDLAFSPDGKKLAVSGVAGFGPGQVGVWELQFGRGIRSLRGLVAPVSKLAFSPDGRLLAALSNDWQVAIWAVDSGGLQHLLHVPEGVFSDNAALAFDPEGHRFAFSSGREARLWDLASGDEVARWELPEGLVDLLAFVDSQTLVLFRVETQAGLMGPYGSVSPEEHPRVGRVRHLNVTPPPKLVAEITDFNWYVINAGIAPDGRYILVDGLGGTNGEVRITKVFDRNGKELVAIPTTRESVANLIAIDPTGDTLALQVSQESRSQLWAMPAGKPTGDFLEPMANALSPGTRYWTYQGRSGVHSQGISVLGKAESEHLVTLGTDMTITSTVPQFDVTGRFLAWGNEDGTVTLCDLMELNRRLSELGLGW